MPRPAPRNPESPRAGALARRLQRRIMAHGPIPFSLFMETALYDPELGYYTRGASVWGLQGDYLTAPQLHPALGQAAAALAIEIDELTGRPDPFDLVEVGPGRGDLIAALAESLRAGRPELWKRLRIWLVERAAHTLAAACARVPAPPRGIHPARSIEQIPEDAGLQGLVIGNELLDAFAVERVTRREGRLLQSRVGLHGGRLVETFGEPVEPVVVRHLNANGIALRDGQIAEVCTTVDAWLRAVGARLARGGLVVVDYGHETSTLYGEERPAGTLVCMRGFRLDDDPLEAVGDKDLTSHVDFGNVRRAARAAGFDGGQLCSLRVFLISSGADLRPGDSPARQLALRHLLVSEIGDAHKVMLLTRGIAPGLPRFGRARLDELVEPRGATDGC